MSKLDDYKDYLKPDPNDATRSIFTIEVSILNDVIESGGIEAAALGIGWVPANEPNPCIFLIEWVKQMSRNAARSTMRPQLLAPYEAQVDAQLDAAL